MKMCRVPPEGAVLRSTLPPNLGLTPKCDMKHCLTNSKHQHIGAKRTVMWPKYAKMCLRLELLGANDVPPDSGHVDVICNLSFAGAQPRL